MPDFLQSLRALPENIHLLDPPNLTSDDASQFTQELQAILRENDSPRARDTILQAAALLPPQAVWSDTALAWAQDHHDGEDVKDDIITYISEAFKQGVFSPDIWIQGMEDESKPCKIVKDVLIRWGEEDFEALLSACTRLYTRAPLRMPIATLLVRAVVEYPYEPSDPSSATHMARVANSSFVEELLLSLILDTGNRLFSLNLRLLLAILPYAPLILTPKVPLMAIVLGRAISWRDRPFIDYTSTARDGVTQTQAPEASLSWDVANSAAEMDIEMPDHLKPRRIAQLYIIAMYGAWPSNVIAFVRDPVSYIRGKNVNPMYAVDWDRVWSPGVLATRMEPLIRDFRLHPSLVVFTSTAELADSKRWERIDAAEFIARSQALSNSDQQATSHIGLFDEDEQPPAYPEPTPNPIKLEKENELLRSEAKFTGRVRKQYLYRAYKSVSWCMRYIDSAADIGRLHRTSLRLNNDEAEIHSFVNRLKAQTSQIAELTSQLSQARTDASQAQQKHVKWQGQLREKVASFREEKATWQTEAARIRAELSDAHATVKAQREELAEVKNERFKLQNRLTEAEPKIRHLSDYETRMKQLTESQRLWDEDVQRCKEALQQAEASKARCHEVRRAKPRPPADRGQQLEQMLRTSRQETVDRARAIDRPAPVSQGPPASQIANRDQLPDNRPSNDKASQDIGFYIKLLEDAEARNVKLERENLELRIKVTNNDNIVDGNVHDTSFIFADEDVQE
uniref:Uncharacterized protein n=1 Tax=Kwoniella dejecticola CBS 10117 TaxID=1296121 RepID=A0A1A6A7D9_9TREE|nr:uncharacterized protein I303_03686 [Kwoniella dejecticola CBS 10117]OBR85971.1 hypothetical protein I303_03686 [Kwoniella dejecticola CBS 10117]